MTFFAPHLARRAGVPSAAPLALALLAAGCASSPSATPGGDAGPAPVGAPAAGAPAAGVAAALDTATAGRLLDLSGIESVIGGRAAGFTRRVALMGEDLTDAELERLVPAVRAAFSHERVRADAAVFLAGDAPDEALDAVLEWMESGATAEVARTSAAYVPPTTLDEFLRALPDDPPDEARARVVAGWVEARGEGDFYVLMDQALEEAAHAVVGTLRPDAPPFVPISGERLFRRLEASSDAAVVAALHRLATVSDEVLRRATEELASGEGRWFVEAYALSVARAIRAAGGRTAVAVRPPTGEAPARRPVR